MVRKNFAYLEMIPGTRNRKNIHLTMAGNHVAVFTAAISYDDASCVLV